MHGAGVDRPVCKGLRRLWLRLSDIFLRIRRERRQTAGGAEVVRPAGVAVPMWRLVRIDGHAAYRILRCDLVFIRSGSHWRILKIRLHNVPWGGIYPSCDRTSRLHARNGSTELKVRYAACPEWSRKTA